MRQTLILGLLALLFVAGCASVPPPVAVTIPTRPVDYQAEVKPILEKRCTVCHSCYNSPCQLKLDSYAGLDRGASKRSVYNAARLRSMEPTRLFTDAQTTEQWRKKEFFSVTANSAPAGQNNSLMIQLLDHKMKNPKSRGEYRPETDELTCAEDLGELGGYLRKHPNRGMPYGFPPLQQQEFDTVAGWLAQGAKGPTPAQQAALETPSAGATAAIATWEAFLNRAEPKYAMTARYLYEHLFLAHISFATPGNEFFELVRSRTAPGQPLDLVASVRPYDDPGCERVYYRFRKVHSTIVHKTHMVFTLDTAQLQRVNELFIQPDWLQTPHLVGYDPKLSANPFLAFEQIPPRSRYQFLLDNSQYMLMTFIHGPVCRGQIALNVINDHFWVMFLDPERDLSVQFPGFLKMHAAKLTMPIEQGSDQQIFSALTDKYRQGAIDFYKARQDFYTAHYYAGLGPDAIWRGNRATDGPLLTVYRHFDSASVHKGALGDLPRTLWVMDYPLFERLYYALVAGFDVYGTAGHQLAIRLYMDRLRIEGESYFIDFLPPWLRVNLMKSWYEKVRLAWFDYYPSGLPAGSSFTSDEPKREFVEKIVRERLLPATGIGFDPVNYRAAGAPWPKKPERYASADDFRKALRAASPPGAPMVRFATDQDANLAYLRIRRTDGSDVAATLVVNRWHDNVAFPLLEEKRLNPAKDTVDILPGLFGSYPNYFFDVREEDFDDFLDLLGNFERTEKNAKRLAKYGINRADERFWATYDWFQQRFLQDEPLTGGLFDLNRYYHKANGD